MKIGILYICTGKYNIFWKNFYSTCEKFFLPGVEKHYFVFTDCEKIEFENNYNKITKIYQPNLGWPYNTLMRFDMFEKQKRKLSMFEYLFFFNANIIFTQKIFPKEFIPFKNDLLVVMHPGYFSSLKNYLFPLLPFERNIKSTAYIPYWCKSSYYMGGINGGKSNYFLKMIEDINFNIKEDLKNGIIAKWHDESHLNKYLINKNKKVLLPNIFGYPEEKIINETPKIIILNKNKFGGHNKLREK